MAAPGVTETLSREQLQAELDHLQAMLPAWREKLRDEAQFQPQFDVLSARILACADPADRDHARQRISAMLDIARTL